MIQSTAFSFRPRPATQCKLIGFYGLPCSNSLNSHTTVTLGFHHDEAEFAVEARRHAEKHASKSRSEWKAQILSEIQEDDDEVGDDDMEDADDEDEDEDIEYGSDEEEDEDMIW